MLLISGRETGRSCSYHPPTFVPPQREGDRTPAVLSTGRGVCMVGPSFDHKRAAEEHQCHIPSLQPRTRGLNPREILIVVQLLIYGSSYQENLLCSLEWGRHRWDCTKVSATFSVPPSTTTARLALSRATLTLVSLRVCALQSSGIFPSQELAEATAVVCSLSWGSLSFLKQRE